MWEWDRSGRKVSMDKEQGYRRIGVRLGERERVERKRRGGERNERYRVGREELSEVERRE